jgi:hypothetical protein
LKEGRKEGMEEERKEGNQGCEGRKEGRKDIKDCH